MKKQTRFALIPSVLLPPRRETFNHKQAPPGLTVYHLYLDGERQANRLIVVVPSSASQVYAFSYPYPLVPNYRCCSKRSTYVRPLSMVGKERDIAFNRVRCRVGRVQPAVAVQTLLSVIINSTDGFLFTQHQLVLVAFLQVNCDVTWSFIAVVNLEKTF